MTADVNKLNEAAAGALMSLIRVTEALEEDGCIISRDKKASTALLPEILSLAYLRAGRAGGDEKAAERAVDSLFFIKDENEREELISSVIHGAEDMQRLGETQGCLFVFKAFDAKVLEKDKDFYRRHGGSDICLQEMYEETLNAVVKIMLKG